MLDGEGDRSCTTNLLQVMRRLKARQKELQRRWFYIRGRIRNQGIRIQRLREHIKDAKRLTQILKEDSVREEEQQRRRARQLEVQIRRTIDYINNNKASFGKDEVIHTIAGSFAGGGVSANSRKRHSRSVMNVDIDSFRIPGYSTVSFEAADFRGIQIHDGDPLVIPVTIRGTRLHRVLIDGGSSVNVMYWRCFKLVQIPPEVIKTYPGALTGFSGHTAEVYGYLYVDTTFEDQEQRKTEPIRYLVIDAPSAYDLILGRPALNDLAAAVSYPQQCMKFPLTNDRTMIVKEDQITARKCYAESTRIQTVRNSTVQPQDIGLLDLDPRLYDPTREAPKASRRSQRSSDRAARAPKDQGGDEPTAHHRAPTHQISLGQPRRLPLVTPGYARYRPELHMSSLITKPSC